MRSISRLWHLHRTAENRCSDKDTHTHFCGNAMQNSESAEAQEPISRAMGPSTHDGILPRQKKAQRAHAHYTVRKP